MVFSAIAVFPCASAVIHHVFRPLPPPDSLARGDHDSFTCRFPATGTFNTCVYRRATTHLKAASLPCHPRSQLHQILPGTSTGKTPPLRCIERLVHSHCSQPTSMSHAGENAIGRVVWLYMSPQPGKNIEAPVLFSPAIAANF